MFANWTNKAVSPELLAKIADAVDSAIIITRAGNFGLYDHKIIYANRAFSNLTGLSQQELIGRSPDILCDQRKSGETMTNFYNECRSGNEFSLELTSYRRGGEDFEMKLSVTPLIDEMNGQAHFILNCAEVKREQTAAAENYNFDISPLIAAKEFPDIAEVFEQYPQQVSEQFAIVEEQIKAVQPEKKSEIAKILEEVQQELERMRAEPGRMQAAAEAAARTYAPELPALPEEEEETTEFDLEEFIPQGGDHQILLQPELPPEENEQEIEEEKEEPFREMTLEEILVDFSKNYQKSEPQEETAEEESEEEKSAEQTEQIIEAREENIPARAAALDEILHSIEARAAEIGQEVRDNTGEEPLIHDLEYFAKSQFLSNMSHDLRTPLNAIIGFAEVIRDQLFGPIDNPRYLSYANDIYKSGQELLGTISEIMELSEVEIEDASVEEGEFDLGATLDSVIDLLSARAFQTDVKLIKRMAENEIRYAGDRRKLKQAFAGVLGNAIKYSPSGGKVEVTSRMDEEGNFELVVYLKSANMIATRSSLGSLLGTVTTKVESEYPEILMARRFVEAHGGKFSIFNSATSGTEIKLILPGNRIVPDPAKRALFRVVQ